MFIIKKFRMYLIAAIALSAIAFAAWKYYEYTQEQIRVYSQNAAVAEQAAAQTQQALERVQENLIEVRRQFDEVSDKFDIAQRRVATLEEKLSKHELDVLARAKPGLVEKVIDNGTTDVLRCLEIASGSPLTEDELNATTKSQINGACPDIANPNYSD